MTAPTGYTDLVLADGSTHRRAVQPLPQHVKSGTTTRITTITVDNDRRKHSSDGTKVNG
jgi:hypothetical protein